MYTGYNLKMDPKFQDFYDKGNQLFSGNKKVIKKSWISLCLKMVVLMAQRCKRHGSHK